MDKEQQTNFIRIAGTVKGETRADHVLYGETFYLSHIEVIRLSGVKDTLPLLIPERLLETMPEEGDAVEITGQIRSYNKRGESGSRLMVTVFARSFVTVSPEYLVPCNEVSLCGFLCKEANYRTTPFQREIADMLLAVNRSYHKSDYLPCIAWGRNARFAQGIGVGTQLQITGRLQSRNYQKSMPDGSVQERTTYEVSCSSIEPAP